MKNDFEDRGFIGSYFKIQMKRMLRLLPSVATVAAALGCVVILMAGVFSRDAQQSPEKSKYVLGIVGNPDENYLGFGISALSSLDDSRFMIDLVRLDEKDALRRLRRGEISGYIVVPDGLVDSLMAGVSDRPIALFGPEGQKGISSILMEEVADIVSVLITRSQSAVYGMQKILRNQGMRNRISEETDILGLRFMNLVMKRTGLCEVETTGEGYDITAVSYYFAGLLLFFLLLSGICSSTVFSRRSRELMRLSGARGVPPVRQVGIEYISYLCLELCCLSGLFVLIGLLIGNGFLKIPEWEGKDIASLIGFWILVLPVTALVAAMQFLLYELVTGIVSGILLQFLSAVALGYLSGCFYPVSVFPESLQKLSGILPTGLAMNYMSAYFKEGTGSGFSPELLGILVYTIAFCGAAVLLRRWKLRR